MKLVEQESVGFPYGMRDSGDIAGFRPGEVAEAYNVRVAPDNSLEVRNGSIRKTTDPLGDSDIAVLGEGRLGILAVVHNSGDSDVYQSIHGSTPTVPWTFALVKATSGVDRGKIASWVDENNDAYDLFSGLTGGLFSWNGTTWATVAGATGHRVEVFNNRVWTGGYTGDPRVYASKIGDHTTWTVPDGMVIPIISGDVGGEDHVRELKAFRTGMLVFKERSISSVDGYGNSSIIVAAGPRGVSTNVGTTHPDSVQSCGDEIIFLSSRGLESFAGGQVQLVSDRLSQFFREWVNYGATDTVACYDTLRNEYRLSLAVHGASTNSHTILFNLRTRALTILRNSSIGSLSGHLDDDGNLELREDYLGSTFSIDANGNLVMNDLGVPGFWVSIDGQGLLQVGSIPSDAVPYDNASLTSARLVLGQPILLSGGYDGHVRLLEYGGVDDAATDGSGGTAYSALVRDRPLTFGATRFQKRARKVRALVTTPETATVGLSVIGDGLESASADSTVMGGTVAYGGQPQTAHAHVNVRGRVIQPLVRASQAGLRISGLTTEAGILNGRH